MKIYRNENNEIVIDGMGITTVILPKDLEGYKSATALIMSRIDLKDNVIITGFHFKTD